MADARGERIFNHEHVPGSFAVPFGDNFATWVGWLVPWGQPLVLLSAETSHHDAMVRQLIRIGFDWVNGYLDGGIDLDALKELSDGTVAPMILDVRQRNEYHAGQIQGALNI